MENPFKQVYGLIENLVLRSAAFQKVATVYHDKRGKLGMTPGPIPFRRPQSDMRTKEIKDWQVAVMQATDPERPRRYLLYYIYQNLLRDDDLQATIENRVLPLQMASYKIVDKNGETVEKAMQLLERTWFQDLRRMSVMAQLQGTLLVDLTEKVNRKTMEIEEISEVPQCNYIAQVGAILERPTDNQGISYRSGGMETYYYQFGKDWDLGLLNILAMPIYAKKMGFGSWLNYIDLYGIPWMFVITNRMDPQRIDELYDMMADMRSAHHGVLKTGESIEFGKEVSGNTTNAFDPFMERCHQMITRLILGQTGTTNNEAYEGTAKVHEQVEKYRHEADKLLFQYVFNQEIIPRLVKISPVYSVFEGCRLEWDDHETLSLKDYIEAIKNLAYTFDFDPEKVAEMTGLPITAIKAVTNQGIQSGGNMRNNGSGNGEDDPDDDPEPPKTGKKKVTDKPDGSFASVVNSLYYDGLEAPHATAVEAASIGLPEKTVDRILERLRSKGFDVGKNIDPDLYEHTFGKLGGAVEKSYGKVEFGSPDYEFLEQMKRNVAVFSAFKTHRQQNEIHSVLFDESGKMKSFDQFRKDTKKIIEDYNVNWLRTEYDTAVSRARFASDFRRYQANKDVMPNLEWLPSLAAHPRDAHRVFYHRIYPLDDPFWRTNYPGSLWNCQCRYRNTDKPATHGDTKESVPPAKGLGENPGITGSVFTDDHPYINDADEEAKEAGRVLKQKDFHFDLAFTSVLKRAEDTLDYILKEMGEENIEIKRSWKLNERHYGALQGLNKDETKAKYGDEQVLLWRRSTDVRPPELEENDPRYPGNDPKYSKLTENELPKTENLLDTIKRVLEYWNSDIKPELEKSKKIIIAAHGNSLRGLIKYLDNISDEDIIKLELQTGNPICYELDDDLKPIKHYYLK